jgi:hypothetical protein
VAADEDAPSARLAAELIPARWAARKAFRRAVLAGLPAAKSAALSLLWPLLLAVLPELIRAVLQLLARLHAADPLAFDGRMIAIGHEPATPATRALAEDVSPTS